MKKVRRAAFIIATVGAFLATTVCFAGTTYTFTVNCQNRSQVVEWGVGSIDPGKEYLRVVTGTKFPDCTVGEYNEATDKSLPKDRISHEGAVIQGIPLIGPILKGIFG